MALDLQEGDKNIEHTIADELSRADTEMAERRDKVKLEPPRVLVVFVVDGTVQTSIELPPFEPDLNYSETRIKTFRHGYIGDCGLDYWIWISGSTLNYHIEKESKG